MSYKILHFNAAEKVIRNKHMFDNLMATLGYLDEVLTGSLHQSEILRQALEEMDWRHGNVDLKILEGRRHKYKGMKGGIAIEGNFSSYDVLQTALLRLQVGFDQGIVDAGIVLINGARSTRSPLGTSLELVKKEVELLYPTISLPVSVILFNLGFPFAQPMKEEPAHAA